MNESRDAPPWECGSGGLLEVKQDIKSQKLEMEKMNERTIRNEESLKSLHKRVDRMEALLQLSPDAVTHETH